MKNKPNYTFQPNVTYMAKYTFPSFNAAGDVVSNNNITTELNGRNIIKYGLKSCIRRHAKRLNIPSGYSCVVE